MSFDWGSLQATRGARIDAVPEMINHTLTVLADLLEETNHACEFSLRTGPLIDDDIPQSVNALLPSLCRTQLLQWLPSWRAPVRDALPELFLPIWQPEAWTPGSPARTVADALSEWVVALMSRLWPDDAQCWNLTVESDDGYTPAYVDTVINQHEQVWLVHLGVTD